LPPGIRTLLILVSFAACMAPGLPGRPLEGFW
jgi:hypothetical protein